MGGIHLPREAVGLASTVGAFILLAVVLAAQACPAHHVTTHRGVLDRFEGTVGVVLVGDDEVILDVPRRYLPEPAREGDVILISLHLSGVDTQDLLRVARGRLDRLDIETTSPRTYQ